MATHCLLITHLTLYDLQQKNFGTYRRLSMIIDAIRATGRPLRIVCTIPPEQALEPLSAISAEIEREVAEVWNIQATVIVTVCAAPSNTRWLFQQLLALFGYSNAPLMRSVFPPAAHALMLDELAKAPAFIVAHRLPSMFVLSGLAKNLPPTFFDLDDVEHIIVMRAMSQFRLLRDKVFAVLSLPSVLLAERRAIRKARLTFVCSDIDAGRIRRLFGARSVEVLPNSVAIPPLESPLPSRPIILMVGIYSYGPNADGADFLIAEIMPIIRSRIPGAELWLVGRSPEHIKSFERQPEGVRFLGFVDDIDSIYREARVVACPIRFGSGTRVKLVEAAAWGKAIVSTTLGAEGLGMTHGTDILLEDRANTFAAACIRLLQDDPLCELLAKNARALAQSTFDRKEIVERLAARFSQALESTGTP